MATLPKINVFQKKNTVKNKPGSASKVAVIAAFEKTTENPILCTTIDEAYEKLGTDTTYNGVSCLDKLFYGASSVLAVNITKKTGTGDNVSIDKDLTTAKLTESLVKIAEEDFDMLFVGEKINSNALTIIDEFLNEKFEKKLPAGFVAYTNEKLTYTGDFSYGLLLQPLTVNDVLYSEVDTAAYYCGLLASLNVGKSMTMKVVPDVTALTEELSFENGGNGLELLNKGYTVFRCLDRTNNKYVVVNSEQPNGLDLYINRTRDFIVKEMALHQFLGERNRTATLNEIKQELDRVKDRCVNVLDLLEDIEYSVEKKSANCVDINITRLLFAGIITDINVYITIEVE